MNIEHLERIADFPAFFLPMTWVGSANSLRILNTKKEKSILILQVEKAKSTEF